MFGLTFLGVAVALWTSERVAAVARRVDLARESYDLHAVLRADAADLFKQYGDALLIGDRDDGADEARLRTSIREDLAALRAVTAAEIRLFGEDMDELERIAEIEALLRRLVADMSRIVAESRLIVEIETEGEDEIEIDIAGGQEALAAILDTGVDANLRTLIEEAMADEAGEVREAEADLARQLALARVVSLGLLTIAGLAATGVAWVWVRRVAKPLGRLLDGVRALSQGRYDARVNPTGRDEIAAIGHVLDDLAARVAARERTLSDQNAALEAAVAERTEDLAHALDRAKAAEEARRLLLADVSHELRTPLTIIKGESDVALRGGDKSPAEYREALTRTRDAAVHTAGLVDDLLFIARTESGRPRLSVDEFDLFALVGQAVAMADREVHVFSDMRPAPIHADRNRVRQAVLALLRNARQHGGREVRVRAERTERGYRVLVEDNGPGLTEEDREMSFTRFWRGSNAAERHDGGAGLGLPIVRAIAEAHGGSVRLDAREGGGTTAVLELPREAQVGAAA